MRSTTKEKITALGIDDGYFKPFSSKKTKLVVTVFRADNMLQGVLSTDIKVDALNATQRIISMLKKSRFTEQASCIFLDGLNFAGFNLVDVKKLYSAFSIPVIAVLRKKPRFEKIKTVLKKFPDFEKRWKLIEKAGPVFKAEKIFFQCHGLKEKEASQLIKKFSFQSNLPEPVRMAHLIASGLTLGESTAP